ncbi:hypothetical protein J31TS4_43270 [Paenibacillus sp. J31TS4]|uniref:RAD55 family ATPase n=1 Tax=Paenibacillus sp. J31TS4 TaxID=2807195 RepID=UPI001AFFE69F|nr:ATPase domain-containing protein [Paenibacillus sp. J31TS4]GIP41047.1 hypothetical protein J31TS4_43270 [Paenibacillus sp. J31TS4]
MNLVSSGIDGFDDILNGGIPRGSTVIVEGAPGTGKTTLGMQFLYNGAVREGEAGLYITFEELPEQLYRDMAAFGWELKRLEKENRLRVLCMSPGLLLEQMTEPGGLFEQLLKEIGCRRVVIDSISLYRYDAGERENLRQTLYGLRTVLRKHRLTSLLLREETEQSGGEPPFENYLFDGVVRLALRPHMGKFRMRTLEVLKMRGRPICEGEHAYRILDEGIHVVPARSMLEDVALLKQSDQVATGIGRLDQLFGGGVPRGTVLLVDTNSKANYKYLVGAIVASHLHQGDKLLAMLSSFNTPGDNERLLALYGISMADKAAARDVWYIEQYDRHYPEAVQPQVLDASCLDNEAYRSWQREKLFPILKEGLEQGRRWFLYYDLNTIFAERGRDYVLKTLPSETAMARSYGMTVMLLCNFSEIGEETSSFLERTSNAVVRTWVDGAYQFAQVTKSPTGKISEPLLVENVAAYPFIRLV